MNKKGSVPHKASRKKIRCRVAMNKTPSYGFGKLLSPVSAMPIVSILQEYSVRLPPACSRLPKRVGISCLSRYAEKKAFKCRLVQVKIREKTTENNDHDEHRNQSSLSVLAVRVAKMGKVINGNRATGPLIPRLKKNTMPAKRLHQ